MRPLLIALPCLLLSTAGCAGLLNGEDETPEPTPTPRPTGTIDGHVMGPLTTGYFSAVDEHTTLAYVSDFQYSCAEIKDLLENRVQPTSDDLEEEVATLTLAFTSVADAPGAGSYEVVSSSTGLSKDGVVALAAVYRGTGENAMVTEEAVSGLVEASSWTETQLSLGINLVLEGGSSLVGTFAAVKCDVDFGG